MNKKDFFTTEMIVALAATVISICALSVSIYEVKIIRQTQLENRRAQMTSVWPNLSFTPSSNRQGLQLGIANNGIGPAIVEVFDIRAHGKSIGNISELSKQFEVLYPQVESHQHTFGNVSKGRVFSASHHADVLNIPYGDLSKKVWQDMVSGHIDIHLCFCSVYEECWTTTLQTMEAERIDECLS